MRRVHGKAVRSPKHFFCRGGAIALLLLSSVGAWAREIPFSLIITHNTKGRLHNGDLAGGWLDVGRGLRRTRDQVRNPILIDAGNSTYNAPESARMLPGDYGYIFHDLAYDVLIPGGLDARGGLKRLEAVAHAGKQSWLASNLDVLPGRKNIFTSGVRAQVIERDGLTLWFGAILDPNFLIQALPDLWPDQMVTDLESTLAAMRNDLHTKKPDVVICFIEGSDVDRDAWERRFPECQLFVQSGGGGVAESTHTQFPAWTRTSDASRGIALLKGRFDNVQRQLVYLEEGQVRLPQPPQLDDRLYQRFFEISEWTEKTLEQKIPEGIDARMFVRNKLAGWAHQWQADMAITTHQFAAKKSVKTLREVLDGTSGGHQDWMLADLTRQDIEALFSSPLHAGDELEFLTLGFFLHTDSQGAPVACAEADGKPLHSGKRYPVLIDAWLAASSGGRFPEFRRILLQPKARLRSAPKTDADGEYWSP